MNFLQLSGATPNEELAGPLKPLPTEDVKAATFQYKRQTNHYYKKQATKRVQNNISFLTVLILQSLMPAVTVVVIPDSTQQPDAHGGEGFATAAAAADDDDTAATGEAVAALASG